MLVIDKNSIDEPPGSGDGLLTAFSAAGITSWNNETFMFSTGRVAAVGRDCSGDEGITTLTRQKWCISWGEAGVGKGQRSSDEEKKGVHDD